MKKTKAGWVIGMGLPSILYRVVIFLINEIWNNTGNTGQRPRDLGSSRWEDQAGSRGQPREYLPDQVQTSL